jgi:hypothetical protein
MFYRPSLRILDESARIARGHSVAVGETAEAHSSGRLVSRFWYEVQLKFDFPCEKAREVAPVRHFD